MCVSRLLSLQEMIVDKVNGQPVPRYLIYDIIKFNVSSTTPPRRFKNVFFFLFLVLVHQQLAKHITSYHGAGCFQEKAGMGFA